MSGEAEALCALCRKWFPARLAFEEHTGWARNRQGGGLNALVARRHTGRYACPNCIERLKHDIPIEQESLL